MKIRLLSLLLFCVGFSQSQYPGWTTYTPEYVFSFTSIAIDTNGNKWIGTGNTIDSHFPVVMFNDSTWVKIDSSFAGRGPTGAVYVDRANNIWVGTANGLGTQDIISKYNGTNWIKYYVGKSIYAITQDKNNNMWFGTSNGVLKYDDINWTEFTTSNSELINNTVTALAIDSSNNLWVGYDSVFSVSKFNGTSWTNHINFPGFRKKTVGIIATRSLMNMVWAGNQGDLISIFTNGNSNPNNPPFITQKINCIGYHSSTVWVGTKTQGVYQISDSGSIQAQYGISNSGISSDDIPGIAVDKNDVAWIISADGKLNKYDVTPFLSLEVIPDSLRSATNYEIKWQAGFFNKIKIEYSTNDGSTWNLIATDIAASQETYNWQVPVVAPSSSQSKLKISDAANSSLSDESSNFTIYTKVFNPVFSVSGGTYNTSQNVTISTSTDLAEIRYTLDGSLPTQSSLLYSQAIKIDSSQTLKARAFKTDWSSSDIITATYLLKALMPSFIPAAGSYSAPQTITITSVSDSVKIYYTLDGSEPTESSTSYISPVLIDTNKVLKAKGFRKGWVVSDTRTGNYTIAGQVFTVNFNTPSIWFDTNFDGKESKTITPTASISYGSIAGYEWKIGNNVIGASNSVTAELPTGTWHIVLSMTSDRGIVKKDSVKISVYAAEATTTGSIESAVSQLSENIYFVTSKGGSVYRFDTTGTIAWTIQTGGSIQSTTCVSSQDNIYVGSNDTRLYSFDYQGTPRWDKAMGGTIVSSPSSGFDTLIYVGISTGRLFALDEAGNIKWNVQTGGPIYSSPSIDENGIAYFGSDDYKLYAVSSTGTVLWTYNSIAPIRTSPALGTDSSIVFGSMDGFVYKVGIDGIIKWNVFTGGSVKSSPIIGLDGIIYVGSYDGKLYSLSKDGQKLWEFNANSPIVTTPSLGVDGSIYFGAMNGTIFALDQSGNQKWILQTGKPILAPMLATNSKMIMVGDTLGKVYIMKIPSDSSLVNLNTEFVVSTQNVSASSYEWWTFKGNNQRTGYRKSIVTGVKNPPNSIPEKFALRQNYPNPFNPTTIIEYDLPKDSRVKIIVFDMLGRQVRTLVDEENPAGSYKAEFKANNLSSGVYFYHLRTNEFSQTKKLMLMR
ncbi:MAG: PQQ-binding-like beta-propeller repeat protein [Ignavibacteriales bacterium]|nr:PQQ-binding-like beta-propeller repeat protein [Ignavibacteriales bacterium]